jgi:RNA polymerase sigma factor (sigma-70 family)
MLDFEALYESYAPEVYRFAFWLAGNSPDAQDITSETFIRAWVNRSTIRTETLKAYLFTIARNLFLEEQRRNERRVTLQDVHPDPAPGPEAAVESQLELDEVRRVLQICPECDRTAFVLRVYHGLPYAEIARVLGLSLSSAKVKVHRVRKKLLTTRLDMGGSST